MDWPTRSGALGCCGSKESAVPPRPVWDEVASAFVKKASESSHREVDRDQSPVFGRSELAEPQGLPAQGLVEALGEVWRIRAPAPMGAGEKRHVGTEELGERQRGTPGHLLP